jgi:protein-tyrosine phosphatase
LGFVDLHSHVLPGLDDGAPDAETSLAMLRGLAEIGFEVVAATPHQRAGYFMPSAADIDAAHAATAGRIAGAGLGLRLALGVENMWDAAFFERLQTRTIAGYDGGPAFLVELPVSGTLPVGVEQRLFDLALEGRLPVLAHPERYPPVYDDLAVAERLGQAAALLIDLGAVAGYHGKKQAKAARRMIEEGLAHAVASDVHSTADVRAAAEGMAWIEKRLGRAALVRLLDEVPRQILAGELER